MVSLNHLISAWGFIAYASKKDEADHDKVRIIIKGGVWRNTGTSEFRSLNLAARQSQLSVRGVNCSLTLPPEDEILKAAISKYGKNVRDGLELPDLLELLLCSL